MKGVDIMKDKKKENLAEEKKYLIQLIKLELDEKMFILFRYVLGVRDRHKDNMMVKDGSTFLHIDFGFLFNKNEGLYIYDGIQEIRKMKLFDFLLSLFFHIIEKLLVE